MGEILALAMRHSVGRPAIRMGGGTVKNPMERQAQPPSVFAFDINVIPFDPHSMHVRISLYNFEIRFMLKRIFFMENGAQKFDRFRHEWENNYRK